MNVIPITNLIFYHYSIVVSTYVLKISESQPLMQNTVTAINTADKLSIFGHGLWAFIKGVFGVAVFITGFLIGFEVLCGVPVAPTVMAIIIGVAGILVITDGFGAKMLLNRFRREIARLSGEVNRLEVVREGLEETDDNLKERNLELKDSTVELQEVIDQQKSEIASLTQINTDLAKQAAGFERANKQFQQSNVTLGGEITRLNNVSKAQDLQIQRLQIVETMANDLLDNLQQNGDDFTAFGKILQDTTDRQENVTNRMERIQHELALARFRELDTDGDGMVSQAELNAWSGNQ